METWRVKEAWNAMNLSTPLGLAIAKAGGATIEDGPRGLMLAGGYTWPIPPAKAFTVGNVVVTKESADWLRARPKLLGHEEKHTWQYFLCLGLPMLPLYFLAAGWSYVRGGDPAVHNAFEVHAGLEAGGYPTVSARERRRQAA